MTALLAMDDTDGTVLMQAGDTSYALRVDRAAGTVRLLHWGASITIEDARALRLPHEPANSFHSPLDGTEELAVNGQVRFALPALDVRYADGSDSLEPVVEGSVGHEDAEGVSFIVQLRDRDRPLAWELHYRVRTGSPVIERHTVYRHSGTTGEPFVLARHASAQWNLPIRDAHRLSSVHGGWASEFQLQRTTLAVGETTLTSRRGHTSHQANPWAAIDDGTAGETHGEVWVIALAASGSWRTTVLRTAQGHCSVLTGAGHEGVEVTLAPGDSWTTPTTTGHYTHEGFGQASRDSHTYVRSHVLPHPEEIRPVLYNSWEATGFDVTPANQRRLADIAASLGAELFVVDDGWFGLRDDDRAGLGDWTPHPVRFPEGLRPLADHVHALDMQFGIWVEPEMINPGSEVLRRHPEWLLHLPDRTASTLRNQLVLDFSREEVTEWAFSWLLALVEAADADFLKWDFNRSFTEAGPRSAGHRVHLDHALAVHRLLDRLRAARPDLRIESCAGGGGRTDLAVLARTDQVWPSDNTDPIDRLTVQHGFTQFYPAQVMSSWVTDSPNAITGRRVPLRFRLHTAMAGVLGLGGDLTKWTDAELTETAEHIAAYKTVRRTVQHGDLHRLGEPGDQGYYAVQYVDPDRSGSVVLEWRVDPGGARTAPPLRLRGLDPRARYRITDDALPAQARPAAFTGAALMAHGIPRALPAGPFGSRMLIVRREGTGSGRSS
ncbi:alpha-galactosidase [Kitasatospora terrestris]|uniref:Alpha-galactosidase n=1 Tax=Kitasatospora terrestris TaxID=258051 RepID=A0ABP9D719_9ACTN